MGVPFGGIMPSAVAPGVIQESIPNYSETAVTYDSGLRFGRFVCQKKDATGGHRIHLTEANNKDKCCGVIIQDYTFIDIKRRGLQKNTDYRHQLDAVKLKKGSHVSIMTSGAIAIYSETPVGMNDDVYVRVDAENFLHGDGNVGDVATFSSNAAAPSSFERLYDASFKQQIFKPGITWVQFDLRTPLLLGSHQNNIWTSE